MKRQSQTTKFVRGGQTTQHWWRMATQVLRTSLFFALGGFTSVYIYLIANNYELGHVRETVYVWLADFNIETGQPYRQLDYVDYEGKPQVRTALDITRDGRMQAVAAEYSANAVSFIWWSLIPAGALFFISAGVFAVAGQRVGENEHVRGSRLVSQPELIRWSKAKWTAHHKRFKAAKKTEPYTIAGIPFPPNAVEAQTGIFGTVGVGKTNAMKELLNTIRARSGRAIIYDRMGGLVRDFYDPETDIIINPFDARSAVWSPFYEAKTPEGFAQIAEVMIPQRSGQGDPFWSSTARLVFEYAARALLRKKNPTNADLRRAIMEISAVELEALLVGTPGAHFFGKHVEKTSASIRANMIAELRFLEFLRDDGVPFSARDWVIADKPGFIFLTGDAEHAAATRNIISTIVEVAANALMTCEERRDPSLWFFLDEVPTLNRLPFLIGKLAEIRQFGGAFVLGYQVFSQLEDIYGDKGAQSIAGTLNNRVVFNTPDARTAKMFSESLGYEDVNEQRENLSFGAHESRDGVAFISQRVERPIVTQSQVQALPQFTAYIRFAYDAPTAEVVFPPIDVKPRAEKFIPYKGGGFDRDSMDPQSEPQEPEPAATEERSGQIIQFRRRNFASWPPAEQLADFEDWLSRVREPNYNPDSGRMESALGATDDETLWHHYHRERSAGVAEPSRFIAPVAEGLMGNIPASRASAADQAWTVPSLASVRQAVARADANPAAGADQSGVEADTGVNVETADEVPAPQAPRSDLERLQQSSGSLL